MICEYCNGEFANKSILNTHKNKAKYCLVIQGKINNKKQIFNCEYCNKVLSSKQYLNIHLKKCEKVQEKVETIFKCEYCNKVLSTKQMLKNHNSIFNIKKQKEDIDLK